MTYVPAVSDLSSWDLDYQCVSGWGLDGGRGSIAGSWRRNISAPMAHAILI